MYNERINETEEERRRRRRRRLEEMKREKRRAELIQRKIIPAAALAVFILAAIGIGGLAARGNRGDQSESSDSSSGQFASAKSGNPGVDGDYVMLTMPPETEAPGGKSAETGAEAPDSVPVPDSGSGGTEAPDSTDAGNGTGLLVNAAAVGAAGNLNTGTETDDPENGSVQGAGGEGSESLQPEIYEAVSTSATTGFADSVISEYGVIIDVENGVILSERNARSAMSPASMTKILTVLTAADALGIGGDDWRSSPVLNETFEITIDITDYSFVNGCSNVGFEVGEKVTVRDLFYGTILPSGADAALGLACYVAGSHEAFVELMNQKLAELGLSESTHFTNCVGLYDQNHYSTVYDIAMILKTAADNPFCRDVLSAHTYRTEATAQHPEGLVLSNWFLRRIEDKDTHGEVICGKTGYVIQSKSCAASLAADVNGKEYICVTAGSSGSKPCINDHVALYQTWLD